MKSRRDPINSTKLQVSVLDIVVMLIHVIKAKETRTVGFEDADRTFTSLVREIASLGRVIPIYQDLVESSLWSANLLDEQGNFSHPYDRSFDTWVKGMLGKHQRFNKMHNYIEDLK